MRGTGRKSSSSLIPLLPQAGHVSSPISFKEEVPSLRRGGRKGATLGVEGRGRGGGCEEMASENCRIEHHRNQSFPSLPSLKYKIPLLGFFVLGSSFVTQDRRECRESVISSRRSCPGSGLSSERCSGPSNVALFSCGNTCTLVISLIFTRCSSFTEYGAHQARTTALKVLAGGTKTWRIACRSSYLSFSCRYAFSDSSVKYSTLDVHPFVSSRNEATR
mmetsp:Transcript_31274/g.70404  ORF Transcript_31274/g.70404 Transcript_31274/m.70404 type:complete len:219 (+) Transcript_31274:1199-1855(+)